MIQIVYKRDSTRTYYGSSNLGKCNICGRTMKAGESVLKMSAADSNQRALHRSCVEDWLAKTPKEGAASTATISEAEAEKEFEKIRRKLMADLRKQGANPRTVKPSPVQAVKKAAPKKKAAKMAPKNVVMVRSQQQRVRAKKSAKRSAAYTTWLRQQP